MASEVWPGERESRLTLGFRLSMNVTSAGRLLETLVGLFGPFVRIGCRARANGMA